MLRRNAAFRRYFAARVVSFLGDGIATVALVLLVQGREGSGVAVGALLLADSLPRLSGPLAGAIADRLPSRTVLVGCDLGQAAIYTSIALLRPPFALLLVLVALATALATLFSTANSAALPRLVTPDELMGANARFNTASNIQFALGPVLGGVLVAAIGTSAALAVNAATFVGSALLIAGVRGLADRLGEPDRGVVAATRQGLAYAARQPVVRALAAVVFLSVGFAAMDNVALVFLAREELDAGAGGYGLLSGAWGAGMLIGSALLLRPPLSRASPARLVVAAIAGSGVPVALLSVAPTLAVAVALQILGGLGNGVVNVAHTTLIQRTVPQAMLGRVYGIVITAVFAGAGLASAGGGLLLDATSARTVFLVAGLGTLAAAAVTARPLVVHEPPERAIR